MGTKLSYKEIVEWFDNVSPDMAELVLGMIKDNLASKVERKRKISDNLKKARAARVTATSAATIDGNAAPVAHRRPGRPRVEHNEADQAAVAGE